MIADVPPHDPVPQPDSQPSGRYQALAWLPEIFQGDQGRTLEIRAAYPLPRLGIADGAMNVLHDSYSECSKGWSVASSTMKAAPRLWGRCTATWFSVPVISRGACAARRHTLIAENPDALAYWNRLRGADASFAIPDQAIREIHSHVGHALPWLLVPPVCADYPLSELIFPPAPPHESEPSVPES
jgi:hypothetical protein